MNDTWNRDSAYGTRVTKMQIERDDMRGDVRFQGVVSSADLTRLRLNPLDRRVVFDPSDKPADWLLALETVFRRLAEQTQVVRESNPETSDSSVPPNEGIQ